MELVDGYKRIWASEKLDQFVVCWIGNCAVVGGAAIWNGCYDTWCNVATTGCSCCYFATSDIACRSTTCCDIANCNFDRSLGVPGSMVQTRRRERHVFQWQVVCVRKNQCEWGALFRRPSQVATGLKACLGESADSVSGLCRRKQRRKKRVCAAQRPTTASVQTWVAAKQKFLLCLFLIRHELVN